MATDTFQNLTSDGDITNFLNYDTLAIPTATDNLILAAIPTNNNTTTGSTLPCLNLTDSSGTGSNYIGGTASIICHGTATTIQVNGGQLTGVSSTLDCSGCIFTTDPALGNVPVSPANYTASNSTQVNASMAMGASGSWSDDGTTVWGAVAMTGGSISSSAMAGTNATDFSGITVIICNSVDMPNATGTATQQGGANVNLRWGTWSGAITWTAVTSIGTLGVGPAVVAKSGSVLNYTFPGSGGTVSLTADFTPVQYVLTGHTSNGNAGTLTLPAGNITLNAASGGIASFGVGGNGTTATATTPGVGYVLNVASGGPSGWGVGGTGSVGTATIPGAAYVLTSTYGGPAHYGISGTTTTPTATLPAAAYVLTSAYGGPSTYGAAGTGSTPSATLTSANNIIRGTPAFGAGGNSIANGNWYIPTASQVLSPASGGPNPGFGASQSIIGTASGSGGTTVIFNPGIGLGI